MLDPGEPPRPPMPDADRRRARNRARNAAIHARSRTPTDDTPSTDMLARLSHLALDAPTPESLGVVVGRGVLWAALAYYGSWYVSLDAHRAQIRYGIVDTVLGMANLVFHEAGHVILAPLGDFMAVLGGSLFQVLLPAVFLAAFLTRYRDPFGAAAMLWWTGQNLVDVAPYIDDARSQTLVLLGGVTGRDVPGYHDWNHILGRLGWLEYDQTIAAGVHRAGSILLLTALAWGGLLLFLQYRQVRSRESANVPGAAG